MRSPEQEPTPALPAKDVALLVRTDFGDDGAWNALRAVVETPSEDGFLAGVHLVEDPAYAGLGSAALRELLPEPDDDAPDFLFVADREALTADEHPILVVPVPSSWDEPDDEPRAEFRAVATELWSVENNLSLANMDWEDFAGGADDDGVFRGF